MQNFLETSIEPLDNEILDFCDSPQFEVLNKILKNFYISQAIIGSNEIDPIKISRNDAILKTLLNLCPDIKDQADIIIFKRKEKNQES
jgi:hypothetical protein